MHVLVIGGTGFIGYHVVLALRAQGDQVAVMCRNPGAAVELFNNEVTAISGDVATLETEDYRQLLQGFDAVVFAAGVDERCDVEGDAVAFFQRANVWPCEQLFAAIPHTNVRRAVLLNSIFSWLDQKEPALQLSQQHPYIRSRVEQNRVAHAAIADSQCVLVTIQVPWVFGAAPHRESQWSTLVAYVRAAAPMMCIRGGASMLSVTALAAAVSGALRFPKESMSLPVGDENLSYVELMQRLAVLVGRSDRQVSPISDGLFQNLTALGEFVGGLFGKQAGGLDMNNIVDLLCREIFFDPSASQALLQYSRGDLDEALQDTVASIPENFWMSSWRKSLNWFARA
jgi:dihydroflavonol-4-reductase